ncbi:MAG: CYTH domain-containing protein, partial [Patescibacteria group bacterium]
MADIEVEIRGPLTKKQFQNLKKFLTKNGKLIGRKSRLSLMYFRKQVPKNVNAIKNDPVDLRLRITDGQATMVMKYGQWAGSDTRKEFEFPIEKNKFGQAIEFLKALGWTKTVVYATDASIYKYREVEFAVVEIKGYGYVYEAEIMVKNKKEISAARKKIKTLCSKIGLREYRSGEFE